jgi:predicted transposase YbfD/YdcC
VDEKSKEITAIPKLLRMLEITGAVVTIDAMGCQKGIARTIRERGADYVLALKANHERLFEQVVASVDGARARLMKGPDIRYHREWSEAHGRTERRRCWATTDLGWLVGRQEWEGLRTVVLIESERFVGDSLAEEERYYVSSLPADAKLLNEAIRSHWAVENGLHYEKDRWWYEDRHVCRRRGLAARFTALLSAALTALRATGCDTAEGSLRAAADALCWDVDPAISLIAGPAL